MTRRPRLNTDERALSALLVLAVTVWRDLAVPNLKLVDRREQRLNVALAQLEFAVNVALAVRLTDQLPHELRLLVLEVVQRLTLGDGSPEVEESEVYVSLEVYEPHLQTLPPGRRHQWQAPRP